MREEKERGRMAIGRRASPCGRPDAWRLLSLHKGAGGLLGLPGDRV